VHKCNSFNFVFTFSLLFSTSVINFLVILFNNKPEVQEGAFVFFQQSLTYHWFTNLCRFFSWIVVCWIQLQLVS